ncbi:hypothetical protein HDU99_009004 [Rhizoclosmatium hyalinum]|nr:hypothetical protein HDU99_009004 [Rhizoclosmatium hyalinum]
MLLVRRFTTQTFTTEAVSSQLTQATSQLTQATQATQAASQQVSKAPVFDRAQVAATVAQVVQRHGLSSDANAAFPSLSVKFKVINESLNECSQKPFANNLLAKVTTPSHLVSVLSRTEWAAPPSLLQQSYDQFSRIDTVEKLFEQLEKDGERPANLYFAK